MSDERSTPMLQITDLHAYYGKSHVLHGVNLHVGQGEIVCLLGRNGVGRSTTAKAVMGQVAARGAIRLKGQDILGRKAYEIARCGIGYVPEDRSIFPDLTVKQNLMLGMKDAKAVGRWSFDDMYALFPRLKERENTPGGVLSGGEQQMLTLCRTLMGDPDLIMIDEPTEGLAPKIVEQVGQFLLEIRKRGISILLIEQKLAIALDISERLYLMGHGRIVFEGTPDDLKNNAAIRKEWLEV
ncbi:MAG: ABC transporter ATP-binding protein [Sulfuritalea sp.]|nr:ABC transporter ATP-binding protein [Sulfuritalea sp.]